MNLSFIEIYFFAFLTVALTYAFLKSCTRLLYRKKPAGRLRGNEFRVKQGTASLENRLTLFGQSFFSSLFTYQVYLIALVIAAAMYFLASAAA